MRDFLHSLSSGELALLAAVVGGVLPAIVAIITAIITTRYTIKHGPNYAEQIEGLDEKFEAFHQTFARTQDDLIKQQAEFAKREEDRYQAKAKEIEAGKWKPIAEIITANERQEHVNKLAINAIEKFRVLTASIHTITGAKLGDLPGGVPGIEREAAVGTLLYIPYNRLVQLSQISPSFQQHETFEGLLRFTVERAEGEPVQYSGEVKFSAVITVLGNTRWFHLIG
jgi:hypothetical protein